MSSLVGRKAPEFALEGVHNGSFGTYRLSDYRGRWLVLFFYPLDFTFVCPTEILAFSDRVAEFRERNAEILGASTDSKYCHLAWTEKKRDEGGIAGLAYPLVADLRKDLARDYGVLDEAGEVALRGLFLVDPDGVVQHATINNLAVGRSVDETLRVLAAFQYVREHGEVCPADWKPGERAMTADWERSKDYFSGAGKPTA